MGLLPSFPPQENENDDVDHCMLYVKAVSELSMRVSGLPGSSSHNQKDEPTHAMVLGGVREPKRMVVNFMFSSVCRRSKVETQQGMADSGHALCTLKLPHSQAMASAKRHRFCLRNTCETKRP
jgi:hypothetical protein